MEERGHKRDERERTQERSKSDDGHKQGNTSLLFHVKGKRWRHKDFHTGALCTLSSATFQQMFNTSPLLLSLWVYFIEKK